MTRPKLVLLCLCALLLLGLWQSRRTPPPQPSPRDGDITLFKEVIARMRAGESYYAAMNAELRRLRYPTASIFNWRAPGTFVLVARAPGAVRIGMLVLVAAAMGFTVFLFRNAPPPVTIAALLMQIGAALLPAIPTDGLYMPETWAGLFLLLSVLGYSAGANRVAVCFAIAAVCARELAMPYVLGSIGLALHAGRRDELRWYAIGLGVFAVYYLAHAILAQGQMQPGDMAHKGSWIAFGGWHFVIRTVAMGGWYLLLPLWAAAIGAVLVAASLWGPADRHLKVMVVAYLAGFCVVGQTFNDYWGLLTGPSWGLATVYGVIGLQRLIRAA